MKTTNLIAAASLLALSGGAALAEGTHGHGGGDDIGKPGSRAKATRTVEITMRDNFYEPESITVKEGETVRFVVRNAGELVHEFAIGTAASHAEHAPMMQMMVDHGVLEPDRINLDVAKSMQETMGHGMHDEPNSVLLEPGKSGELVWTFPQHAKLEFACTVPGHYDGGMVGEIELSH